VEYVESRPSNSLNDASPTERLTGDLSKKRTPRAKRERLSDPQPQEKTRGTFQHAAKQTPTRSSGSKKTGLKRAAPVKEVDGVTRLDGLNSSTSTAALKEATPLKKRNEDLTSEGLKRNKSQAGLNQTSRSARLNAASSSGGVNAT
jgi:hypothetical protein